MNLNLNLENDDEIKSYLNDIKNFPDLIISFIGELDTEQDAVKNIKRTINIILYLRNLLSL